MANINFYIPDKDEIRIKQMAAAEGTSVSEFCRNKILFSNVSSESTINSVPVEAAINEMNNNMQDMLKKLIVLNHNLMKENRYYGELLGNYFTALFTSQETNLQESFDLAQQAAEESVKDL